ncbi:hypothetical protein PRZ48_005268 [Zasmidium cellare]|uniref:SprT-like domain-containing protein n=1 Tax=Zasmidium cellare TaxID=395010 RepID=A0ABR0ES96_ZASCE|nr:hypothetical protein PRZ48_005268 [Zasmidium cellare]
MSLPSAEDLACDLIGPYITQIETHLQSLPDRKTVVERPGFLHLKLQLHGIEALQQLLSRHIEIGEKSQDPLSPENVESLALALDYTFLQDNIFDGQFDADFRWDFSSSSGLGESTVSNDQVKTKLCVHALNHATAKDIIGTFLHELVHIFLEMSFKVHGMLDGESEDKAADRTKKALDGNGHAWYFQRLAAIVEKATMKLLGYHVDIGRLDAIKKESYKQGSVPELAYFEALLTIFPMPGKPTAVAAHASVLEDFEEQDSSDDEEQEEHHSDWEGDGDGDVEDAEDDAEFLKERRQELKTLPPKSDPCFSALEARLFLVWWILTLPCASKGLMPFGKRRVRMLLRNINLNTT